MGIIAKAKDKLGLKKTQHPFRCDDCGDQFESPIAAPALVKCPECGSDSVASMEVA